MATSRKKNNKIISISRAGTKPKSRTTQRKKTKHKIKVLRNPIYKLFILVFITIFLSVGTFYLFFYHDKDTKIVSQENKTQNINETIKIVPPLVIDTKPKMVIIIDDMSTLNQVNRVKDISLKLSPSFLPPSKIAPNSANLVSNFSFYMVHLPLEALNFDAAQDETLLASDSYEKFLETLTKLKKQFPNALYYNNHTGSKFTADYKAMNKLFIAMRELGLIFVDSRTTAQTKAPEIAKKFGKNLFQRDVFLDHIVEKNAIKEQLNIALEKANENGFVIVIGHPHKETLEVLKEATSFINSKVEVVYLNELQIAKN